MVPTTLMSACSCTGPVGTSGLYEQHERCRRMGPTAGYVANIPTSLLKLCKR